MRKDFGSKTWMYPMPVLIIGSYDENGKANAMNAAWGAIHNDDTVIVCISKSHKTMANIIASKAFTISFATEDSILSADYLGVVSGNTETKKMENSGFTVTKSRFVNAPIINELPMTMECVLVGIENESVIGKIINVSADESILAEDGKIDYKRLKPITYDPIRHHYISLGEVVGNAHSDGKKLKK